MKLSHRARILLFTVLTLLSIGTVGFHTVEGWPWFQSFYATLMSLSTTGANPLNQLTPGGQMLNAVVIILGVGVVGYALGTLTQTMLEFELASFFGKRKMERDISKLKDHIIICGAGRVGRRLATEVSARGLPLIVIENTPARAQWAQDKNLPVLIGDASSEDVLRQARIEHARGLASAVTSDAQNVYIVLTARGLAPKLPIVARASEEDAESKLRTAGASVVISPYGYAGQRMAHTLTRPQVQRFLDLALSSMSEGGLDLQIEEMQVSQGSTLSGINLSQAGMRERGIIVLAIRRSNGQLLFNPGPDERISPGDYLIAMGDTKKLKEIESLVVKD